MGSYALVLIVMSAADWWISYNQRQEEAAAAAFGQLADLPTWPFWQALLLHPPQGPAAMDPSGPGFHWWQVLTAPFVIPPGGFAALAVAFLGFAFFAAGVERFLGVRRFLSLWLVASLGAGFGGFLFGPLLQPSGVHFGCGPAVLALIVVYCLMTPNAMVTFFMILPIKLKWIAAMVAAWVLVKALAMTSPLGMGAAGGGYHLGGLLAGFLWFRYGDEFLEGRRRSKRAGSLLKMVLDDAGVEMGDEGAKNDDEQTFH